MVATKAVLLSCIIDAEEERDVVVIYTPNAFVQTQIEDKKYIAFIKIHGVLVDILVEIAPEMYKYHIKADKKGMKQSLVQCHNALYGTLVARIIYYGKFTNIFTDVGF